MEKLPTKTKIAAWWMIVGLSVIFWICWGISALIFLGLFMYSVSSRFLFPFLFSIYYFFIPAIAIFNFCFGLFLLRRREWAWKLGIVTLLFSIIVHGFFVFLSVSFFGRNPEILLTGFLGFGIPFIGSLIPLILLLLDRKNFWKVAS